MMKKPSRVVMVTLPEGYREELERIAARERRSLSWMAAEAIRLLVEADRKQPRRGVA